MSEICKVTWTDVREQVSANPLGAAVARATDNLLATDRMRNQEPAFYVARYRYADLIVSKGEFRPPCQHRHQAQVCCSLCREMMQAVEYSAIPLAVSLERSVEVLLETPWNPEEPRMAPLRMIQPGEPFGVFEVLDTLLHTPYPKPPWSVSAGARSVWILAPLGDAALSRTVAAVAGVSRIKPIEENAPHEAIAAVAGHGWSIDVLLFPNTIVQNLTPSDALFRVLLEIGWKQSSAVRHALFRTQEFFPSILPSNGNGLSETYRCATVRHLMDASKGEVPLFEPAWKAKAPAGPFIAFENVLAAALDRLGKEYRPIVLQPVHLLDKGAVGYYSFRCPTVVGVKRPNAKVYAQVPALVRDDLENMQKECASYVDYSSTMYFAFRPYDEVTTSSSLPIDDFDSDGRKTSRVYLKSPFLISGVRLVRS